MRIVYVFHVAVALVIFPASFLADALSAAEAPATTGPATEKRFPPLGLPAGFKATLFACDPLIEYPSVIALGPKPNSLFVAQDYMTGLGTNSPRRSEIKLVQDTDGDGYADTTRLFAGDFNSIQGLAWHEGTVYAMHAPLLTALRDTDGDGRADFRRDLLSGLGLSPKENPNLLHCANGVTPGHDGWLYLALGDRGCTVKRPEGDTLRLLGGGILRCRPDGHDLHIFSTGLRNIYDVALDAELNVFVRDNENDGGDYMIRVCHSFFGADHGYPYHYYERPDEGLMPLADLGRGSSAGGVIYLETAFPPAFRGSLFFCEWGRAVVRYDRRRLGSTFAPMKELDFAAGGSTDPYGLKPTDVIVDRDGSLLFSDWGDGQRPKRGRGRVYRITFDGESKTAGGPVPNSSPPERGEVGDWIARLDSAGYYARTQAQREVVRQKEKGRQAVLRAMSQGQLGVHGRLHGVWVLAAVGGRIAIDDLLSVAEADSSTRVRAQAVRALADLTDPVLVAHRLDAGRGDPEIAERLAKLAVGADPQLQLEVVVALGRLRWEKAPGWLAIHLKQPDAALSHAAMQTLRRSGNWPGVLKLLDLPQQNVARSIALRAVADRTEPVVVDGVLDRLVKETDADRRRQYADLLTRVWKKRGERPYWGYRPPPRPANRVAWDRTAAIGQALDRVLALPGVRTAILRRIEREQIPVRLPRLKTWLRTEREQESVAAILDSLRKQPADDVRELLRGVTINKQYALENRLSALSMLVAGLDESNDRQLLDVAKRVEDGAVSAAILRELGRRPKIKGSKLLLEKLSSEKPDVRAAAIETLAALQISEAAARVPALIDDPHVNVRRAAASAAGKLQVRAAVVPLLKHARDADPGVRSASLQSLRALKSAGAVAEAVRALDLPATQPAALAYLREFGGPPQLAAVSEVARQGRSTDVLAGVVRALAEWSRKLPAESKEKRELERAVATVQGDTGVLLRWMATTAVSTDRPIPVFASGSNGLVTLPATASGKGEASTGAYTDIVVDRPRNVQFLGSSNGTLTVSLDGRQLYSRPKPAPFNTDSDRFETSLEAGVHRIAVAVVSSGKRAQFHLRLRERSSSAERERLIGLALEGRGNVRRGREVFLNVEKSLCLKCHRIGEKGERIGPDLTGVGSRFSRIHLIESILEPSRTIAPSYETRVIVLKNGRVLTGVKAAETAATLTLADSEGKKIVVQKSEIEETQTQSKSTMPDGVEKRLSSREFVDLIGFLLSEKKK